MSEAPGGGPWPRHIIDGCLFSSVSGVFPRCVACDDCSPVPSSLFAMGEKALFRMVDSSSVGRWARLANRSATVNVGLKCIIPKIQYCLQRCDYWSTAGGLFQGGRKYTSRHCLWSRIYCTREFHGRI